MFPFHFNFHLPPLLSAVSVHCTIHFKDALHALQPHPSSSATAYTALTTPNKAETAIVISPYAYSCMNQQFFKQFHHKRLSYTTFLSQMICRTLLQ